MANIDNSQKSKINLFIRERIAGILGTEESDINLLQIMLVFIVSSAISAGNVIISNIFGDLGFDIFTSLTRLYWLYPISGYVPFCIVLVLFFFYYLFDIKSPAFMWFMIVVSVLMIIVASILKSSLDFYNMSVGLNLLYILWNLFLIAFVFHNFNSTTLFRFLYYKSFLLALCSFVIAIVYQTNVNNYFDNHYVTAFCVKFDAKILSYREDYIKSLEVYYYTSDTSNSCKMLLFTMWINPYIYSVLLVIFGLFLMKFAEEEIHYDLQNGDENIKKVELLFRRFKRMIFASFIVGFGFYLVQSVGSSQVIELQFTTYYVKSIVIALLILISIFVYYTYKVELDLAELHKLDLIEENKYYINHDAFRASMVLLFGPLWFIFDILTRLKKLVLKHVFTYNEEEVRQSINVYILIKSWWKNGSLSSVMNYTTVICMLYFLLNVIITKLTYVFLAYLNEVLVESNLVLLLVVYFVIGVIMFCLPPVPGAPVYIVGGLMISNFMHENWDGEGETKYFYVGVGVATLFATGIKCVSLLIVQSLAEKYSDNKYIQTQVGTHKPFMKAMGDIFRDPDYYPQQVLCFGGMPDWPMSALTGLLKLSYCRVQMACLPVGILAFFYVFSGACMVLTDDFYVSLNTAVVLFTVILQCYLMYLATYYIGEYLSMKADFYNNPDNMTEQEKELLAEEMKDEVYNKQLQLASNMNVMTYADYFFMMITQVCMVFSLYSSVYFETSAFRTFSLNGKIGDPFSSNGLEGNVLNLIYPLGWGVIAAFFFGVLLYKIQRSRIEEMVRLYHWTIIELKDGLLLFANRIEAEEFSTYNKLLLIQNLDSLEFKIYHEYYLFKNFNSKLFNILNTVANDPKNNSLVNNSFEQQNSNKEQPDDFMHEITDHKNKEKVDYDSNLSKHISISQYYSKDFNITKLKELYTGISIDERFKELDIKEFRKDSTIKEKFKRETNNLSIINESPVKINKIQSNDKDFLDGKEID